MIITKTPFRISFFGGGTDYPEHFERHGGAVLATAIDKSTYLSATRFYSRLFDYSIRIAYRKVECVRGLDEIEHGPFRECLRWAGITENIEVDTAADLPAFAGLGSSSSFVVGLLNTLTAFQGAAALVPDRTRLPPIEIERGVLKEAVGCQDQTFAAVGGFNLIEFRRTDDIVVHRLPLGAERIRELEAHLLMVFTGIKLPGRGRGRSADRTHPGQRPRTPADARADGGRRVREILMRGARTSPRVSRGTAARGVDPQKANSLRERLERDHRGDLQSRIVRRGMGRSKLLGCWLAAGSSCSSSPRERRAAVLNRLAHLEEVPILLNAPGSHVIYA